MKYNELKWNRITLKRGIWNRRLLTTMVVENWRLSYNIPLKTYHQAAAHPQRYLEQKIVSIRLSTTLTAKTSKFKNQEMEFKKKDMKLLAVPK
jgi:hypothetical protein